MPKQTLALIVGLVVITFVLFVIALKTAKPVPQTTINSQVVNENVDGKMTSSQSSSIAQAGNTGTSVLNILPKPVSLAPGQRGEAEVNLDAANNDVTAVQLEIGYDPNFISDVKVLPAGMFTNSVVLIDKNSVERGRYTFAFGISPSKDPIRNSGIVAKISFKALNKPGESTQIGLLPTTLVTARGISNSVLKQAEGTLVEISTP